MSVSCKYCSEPEDRQYKPGLTCEVCSAFVHLTCLRRPGTPGDFDCDIFFKFTCEDCGPEKKERLVRYKFSWANVIYLTLYHLSKHSYGISHHGYFHYKTHICSFIDRHWQALFEFSNKQKKNWIGTIAGVLSVYNKILFKSGSAALGETGWWRLLHDFSPAVSAYILQEFAKEKPSKRRQPSSLDRNFFNSKVAEMGYKELLNEDPDPDPVFPFKKRRIASGDSVTGTSGVIDSDSSRPDALEDTVKQEEFDSDMFGSLSNVDNTEFEVVKVNSLPAYNVQSDTSSVTSYQNSALYYDSDSRSSEHDKKTVEIKQKKVAEDKVPVRRESLFSKELNSEGFPWEEKEDPPIKGSVEMTQYEEILLLKKVEGMISKVRDPSKKAYLCRFKAKLALRRLKRHKHLPLFDLDKTVKLLGGYVTEDLNTAVNVERVLDRFQRSYLLDKLSGTISTVSGGTQLVSAGECGPFRSPYSGALLKPYIRRDRDSNPLWLRITDELLRKTNKHIKDYVPPPRLPLDYTYVQPHHIAAINNLCAQFFWPGIDLSEALQYPEFSCVVWFGRAPVACAFLVPDAARGEAYVSFVLTRPEWRRAGIATFMMYHLLQTCTGKDVTLHVSPTNPAIFLYQKFGFKVEEMIQDFYEKYYDIDYKGCRHALFLRLAR